MKYKTIFICGGWLGKSIIIWLLFRGLITLFLALLIWTNWNRMPIFFLFLYFWQRLLRSINHNTVVVISTFWMEKNQFCKLQLERKLTLFPMDKNCQITQVLRLNSLVSILEQFYWRKLTCAHLNTQTHHNSLIYNQGQSSTLYV